MRNAWEDLVASTVTRAYVNEAISLQQQGAEIKPARRQSLKIPPQLKAALAKNKRATAGFQSLTKGRQREYAEYIAEAKRVETKTARLKKIIPMIIAQKGLNDKYRKS